MHWCGLAVATIEYTNGDRVARQSTLQVNGGQIPTTLALPPTPRGTVSAIVSLARGTNSLTVSGAGVTAVEVRELPGTAGTQVIGAQSSMTQPKLANVPAPIVMYVP